MRQLLPLLVFACVLSSTAVGQFGLPAPASRKPPLAILINGYQDCCVTNGGIIEKLQELNAITPFPGQVAASAWDDLYSQNGGNFGNDDRILDQLEAKIDSALADQAVILVGHSFGGDDILKFLTTYPAFARHTIDAAIVFDAVGAGGFRSQAYAVHSGVRYFYNRWQTNETPGFFINYDFYYNPFPINSGTSGSVPNPNARFVSQDTENTKHDAAGNGLRKDYWIPNIDFEGGGFWDNRPVYNTHADGPPQLGISNSITYDSWLTTQTVDLLDGIFSAYIDPSYAGDSWGTPLKPYRLIREALLGLSDHSNHVDTIILKQGEHTFVEASNDVMDPKYRVIAGSSNTILKDSSWNAGNIQTPAGWTMKIDHSSFGSGVTFNGPGGFEFQDIGSVISGAFLPSGTTIVKGSDAAAPAESIPNIRFRGPTTINALRLGDPSHATQSMVELTFEGSTILNFERAEFVPGLSGNPRAQINIKGVAQAARLSSGLTDTPSPTGEIIYNVEGVLHVNELEQLSNAMFPLLGPVQAPTHFGGSGTIIVEDKLEWQGNRAIGGLGSKESSIVLEHGGRFVQGRSRFGVAVAGYLENRGYLSLDGNHSGRLGISNSDEWTRAKLESNLRLPGYAKWVNAPGASIDVSGPVLIDGGSALGGASITNSVGAHLDVHGTLTFNNGWSLINEGTLSVHDQAQISLLDFNGNGSGHNVFDNTGRIEIQGGALTASELGSTTLSENGELLTGVWYVGNGGKLSLPPIMKNQTSIILDGTAAFPYFGFDNGVRGTLELRNGQVFSTAGPRASFFNEGNLKLDGATLLGSGLVQNESSGFIKGTGQVAADVVVNRGTISPGTSVGQLNIGGNYVQESNGELSIEFAGLASLPDVIYDSLVITSSATLGGELHLLALSPLSNDIQLRVIDATSLSGAFSSIPSIGEHLGFGTRFNGVTYDVVNGDVYVSLLHGLSGDFNFDGRVDYADYQVWRSYFGSTTFKNADGNGDGVVDAADYAIWRDNPTAENSAGTIIPEPTYVHLLVIGLLLFGMTTRTTWICK